MKITPIMMDICNVTLNIVVLLLYKFVGSDNKYLKKIKEKHLPSTILSILFSLIVRKFPRQLIGISFVSVIIEVCFSINLKTAFCLLPLLLSSLTTIIRIDPLDSVDLLLKTVFSDLLQQLTGMAFGTIKCIKISPNKSLEGYIITMLIFWMLFGYESVYKIVIPGIIGDLLASYIKRINGKKDFSNILGGIGGVYDRIDSIIFVFASYYITKSINLKPIASHIITICSIIFGISSKNHITINNSTTSLYRKILSLTMMLFATICDKMDGYIARKYNIDSTIGKYFDSIADLYNYGIIPMYHINHSNGNNLPSSIFYGLATLTRLIRFTFSESYYTKNNRKYFIGFPSTFTGLLMIIMTSINNKYINKFSPILLGILMNSMILVPTILTD